MKNDNIDIEFSSCNLWGFPDVPAVVSADLPPDWVAWDSRSKCNCYADTGLHFYCDDFKFSAIWSSPEKYIDTISKYKIAIMPDFSMFYEVPFVAQMWNKYRNMWLCRFYDMHGITMIPNINPSDRRCWDWSFLGFPQHSVVSFSSIGSMNYPCEKRILFDGYNEMIKRIEPIKILYFCRKIEDCPSECTPIIINFGR